MRWRRLLRIPFLFFRPRWMRFQAVASLVGRVVFLISSMVGQVLRGVMTWQKSQAAVKAHHLFPSPLSFPCPSQLQRLSCQLKSEGDSIWVSSWIWPCGVSGGICLHYFYSYHEWVCTGCFQAQLTFSEIWILRVSWQRVIGRRYCAIGNTLSL